jgi:hypothetical protein
LKDEGAMKDWDKLKDEPELPWWKWLLFTLILVITSIICIYAHCQFYAPNYRALGWMK